MFLIGLFLLQSSDVLLLDLICLGKEIIKKTLCEC